MAKSGERLVAIEEIERATDRLEWNEEESDAGPSYEAL